MITFFINIWNWIISHLTPILTVTTLGELIGLVAIVIKTIKLGKSTSDNIALSSALTSSLETLDGKIKSIDEFKTSLSELKDESLDNKNTCKEILTKVDAILDVMHVVYATIRDETVRKSVNSIINNVKYGDKTTNAEKLESELDAIKNELAVYANSAAEKIEQVKKKTKHKTVTRY